MSFTDAPALCAIAFQLAARLEEYEADMQRIRACPTDPVLHHRISHHMDDLRMYAAALPKVSVDWVELLIRHFELMQSLWLQRTGHQGDREALEALAGSHHDAVRHLTAKCAQLLPRA